MKTLLIGTNNPSKLAIIEAYLSGLDVRCVSPAAIGLTDTPDEQERSARDNAIVKAMAWHRASGLPVVAEDSGLVFLDLPATHPDQPGVTVRRASGHTMTDDEMLEWYCAIIHRHGGKLRAAWEDAWCVLKDERTFYAHSDTPETLERKAKLMVETPCETRLPGWPLDSLTYVPSCGKYKAEMTMEEMNQAADCMNDAAKSEREELIAWLRDTVQHL